MIMNMESNVCLEKYYKISSPCIISHNPVPYLCPSDHYRGYEKKMMTSREKKAVSVFLPYKSSTAIWTVYPQFFSLFMQMHLRKLICECKGAPQKLSTGEAVSEQLPGLHRRSQNTSGQHISKLKVKTTNTPAGGYPQRHQLCCVSYPTRERQVVP